MLLYCMEVDEMITCPSSALTRFQFHLEDWRVIPHRGLSNSAYKCNNPMILVQFDRLMPRPSPCQSCLVRLCSLRTKLPSPLHLSELVLQYQHFSKHHNSCTLSARFFVRNSVSSLWLQIVEQTLEVRDSYDVPHCRIHERVFFLRLRESNACEFLN